MMKEVWKAIKGYEDLYEVSNTGIIRSIDRKVHYRDVREKNISGSIKKPTLNVKGYLKVTLFKNGKGTTKEIQRIVAEAFIPNPNNKNQVNHIDGNKTNNNVSNLEWCTPKENSQHRLHVLKKGIVAVNQFDMNGKFIRSYASIKEAARENNIKPCSISNVINCKRNSAGGYYWALV